MTEELEEFVIRVKFPRHPLWSDEDTDRVEHLLFNTIDDAVRGFYDTERWKSSGVELV